MKKISGLPEADPGYTLGGLPQRLGFIQGPSIQMPRSSFVVKITGIAPEVRLAHYVRATPMVSVQTKKLFRQIFALGGADLVISNEPGDGCIEPPRSCISEGFRVQQS